MEDRELEHRLTEVVDRSMRNEGRIKKLESRQDNLDKLVSSVAELANEQVHIKDDVIEIKEDVKALADRPRRRVDNIVDKAIWAVCAALIAYLLAQIGL